jgi:hypothetical protein
MRIPISRRKQKEATTRRMDEVKIRTLSHKEPSSPTSACRLDAYFRRRALGKRCWYWSAGIDRPEPGYGTGKKPRRAETGRVLSVSEAQS